VKSAIILTTSNPMFPDVVIRETVFIWAFLLPIKNYFTIKMF
jgi:hypothetical protein